jgi:hypothetical protein
MLILDPPCSDAERLVLRAFRRTAEDVHRIYAPYAERPSTLDLRDPESPRLDALPEDTLRSLAMAVRQAYMPTEVTNFQSVCAIVGRTTDPAAKEYISVIQHNWQFALVSPPGLGIEGRSFGGKQVFDTWLYARAVHRDPKRQEDAELLTKMNLLPSWVVQNIVRNLAVCIVQLDVAVADALGEAPLKDPDKSGITERPFRF